MTKDHECARFSPHVCQTAWCAPAHTKPIVTGAFKISNTIQAQYYNDSLNIMIDCHCTQSHSNATETGACAGWIVVTYIHTYTIFRTADEKLQC